ncbi:MAG: hypothetical protein WCG04_04625 [Alphaproteobacteria bacterium]
MLPMGTGQQENSAFAYAHCYFLASGMTVGHLLWLSLLSRTGGYK